MHSTQQSVLINVEYILYELNYPLAANDSAAACNFLSTFG